MSSPFSDEDLKEVKGDLRKMEMSASSLPLDEMYGPDIGYTKVKALLARLEAAEVLAGYWARVSEIDDPKVKAWLRSKGEAK